jgi:hypothetical protein
MTLKPLPDPHAHADTYIPHMTMRYVRQARRAGCPPDPELTRLICDRVNRDAAALYEEKLARVYVHNLRVLHNEHRKQMAKLRREHGAKWRAFLKRHRQQVNRIKRHNRNPYRVWSLLFAGFFGVIACYTLAISGNAVVSACMTVGMLGCIAMLVLRKLHDKTRS